MRARRFASAFAELLAEVDRTTKTWISEEDISLGVQWFKEIEKALKSARAGVVLLTPENYRSPWLVYEAGSMVQKGIRVIPIRVNLPINLIPRDYPLVEQATDNSKEGIRKVVDQLQGELGSPTPDDRSFDTAWAEFGARLERPHAVFRPEDRAKDMRVCVETLLDIAKESVENSCRSLVLLAECSRILTTTDWCSGLGVEGETTGNGSTPRIELEIEALRQGVETLLRDEDLLGSQALECTIRDLVVMCNEVHRVVGAGLERHREHAPSRGVSENENLEKYLRLAQKIAQFRRLKGLLTLNEVGPNGQEDLRRTCQEALDAWLKSLPRTFREPQPPPQTRKAEEKAPLNGL